MLKQVRQKAYKLLIYTGFVLYMLNDTKSSLPILNIWKYMYDEDFWE